MHRPAVFIGYSHDSPAQAARVRALGASLARDGCDCRLDVHKDSDEDWPAWMTRQLIEADRVLCVATETYERRFRDRELPDAGLGVGWEAGLIRRLLYAKKLHNDRIFPVLFEPSDRQHVPLELQGYDYFLLDGQPGYESLLRKLLQRPLHARPETGTPPDLPTHPTAPLFARPGDPASIEPPAGPPPPPAPPERIARSRLLDAVPPAEPRPTGASPALRIWQKKLEFLLVEEAKAAEAAARFKLREDIEEARQKIAELGGDA